jgi:NADPH:quinone reductase-like Zn-dependent oxidoreductase
MNAIPSTMQAVLLRGYEGGPDSITFAEVPVHRPGPGQVLIRIAASPVNPSDLAFIRGLYGFKKALPAIPGFEGSGTVVAAGGGMMARLLLGRRVACAAAEPDIHGGAWKVSGSARGLVQKICSASFASQAIFRNYFLPI